MDPTVRTGVCVKWFLLVVLAVLVWGNVAEAKPRRPLPPRPPPRRHTPHGRPGRPVRPERPSIPIPSLPHIAKVRVAVGHKELVVTHEITILKGDSPAGNLALYVAFGAPGAPRAFDARLVSLDEGHVPVGTGEPLTVEHEPHRPATSQLLLGRPQMAGAVVRIPEGLFRVASARSGAVLLRLRSLHGLPAEEADGGREVVVRLGMGQEPLTLRRIEVAPLEAQVTVGRATGSLCGPDADSWPLSVAVVGKGWERASDGRAPLNTSLAIRRPTDDLCVRFWTRTETPRTLTK
jgi:hypothetical protein